MTMNLDRRNFMGGAIALLAASPLYAQPADAWPTRAVRLVVPGPPGGGTDLLGRLLADNLSRAFKQTFVVDNKAGANGMLASDLVAHAPADGSVLLFSYTGAMVVNPGLFERALDPLKSFEPVAQVGSLGNVLLAVPDLPVGNLRELVAYARQQPAPMSYGTWGVGSGPHLTMESFLGRAKIGMTHVPYKGASSVTNDLLGGTLKIGWVDISSVIPYVKSGKLRPLAVSGPQRAPQFPDVPTMTEQGFPFETMSWYGVFAPARTPRSIVERLNAEVVRIVSTPEFRERLYALNMPESPTPSVNVFRQRVADDLKTWREILQDLGIKPE